MGELVSSSRKMFADGIAYNEGLTDYANKYKKTLQREVLQEIRQEIAESKYNHRGEYNRELAFNICLQIIDNKIKELSE